MPFCSKRLKRKQRERICTFEPPGLALAACFYRLFTHISVMASGRWAGIAVKPRPRQSTMLLLQVHMGGQEPDARLHGWTKALPP